ncbi:hypothetical protein ALQ24_200093 [Pseudomonas syringae pv. antirrhini]|nr:hypothetical protein ALQ24_200093 [Pseudomonas syringae pv. antirrhini]
MYRLHFSHARICARKSIICIDCLHYKLTILKGSTIIFQSNEKFFFTRNQRRQPLRVKQRRGQNMQPALDSDEILREVLLRLTTEQATRQLNAESVVENMLYQVGIGMHGATAMATEWAENADQLADQFSTTAQRILWMAEKVSAGCRAPSIEHDAQLATLDEARAWYIHTVGYDPHLEDPSVTLADIQLTRVEYLACFKREESI